MTTEQNCIVDANIVIFVGNEIHFDNYKVLIIILIL